MRFAAFLIKWLERHTQDAQNGDKSWEYVHMLRTFYHLYWFIPLGDCPLESLTTEVIQSFYDKLCRPRLNPTFNLSVGYRSLLMSTLKSAVSDAMFQAALPMPAWPKVNGTNYGKKAPQVLTEEQQDRVIDQVPKEHRPMVMTFFYHGVRMAEIRKITKSYFNREAGTLTVPTAKGGCDRVILLEPKLLGLLERSCIKHPCIGTKASDLLFSAPDCKPYTRSVMHKIIRKALNKAGFLHITPNQAGRHSAATNYLRRGASTRQVQFLLGHSKITTTERYLHPEVLDQENLRRGR